jgi:hypothetical protein
VRKINLQRVPRALPAMLMTLLFYLSRCKYPVFTE